MHHHKRIHRTLLIVGIVILLALSCVRIQTGNRGAQAKSPGAKVTFDLPASLQYIGDEAFFGTSLEAPVFHEGLLGIGERAFTDDARLSDVYIPATAQHIGANAFPENVLIHGTVGSYAQTWARENGFEFVVDDVWSDRQSSVTIHIQVLLVLMSTLLPADLTPERIRRRAKEALRSMRQQDRPELYPINYRFP